MEWIPYIFWVMAAFFNAVMDTIESIAHFRVSIFKHLDIKFWCKEISWRDAKKIFGYKLDGWHFCKSLMIICMAATVVFTTLVDPIFRPWFNLIVLGLLWNGTFNLFYNYILRSK